MAEEFKSGASVRNERKRPREGPCFVLDGNDAAISLAGLSCHHGGGSEHPSQAGQSLQCYLSFSSRALCGCSLKHRPSNHRRLFAHHQRRELYLQSGSRATSAHRMCDPPLMFINWCIKLP